MKIVVHLANVVSIVETLMIMLSVINYAKCDALMDPQVTLDCHRRAYSHKVSQTDSEGRMCWDTVTVMSCWGRCDSNEVTSFSPIRSG